MKEKDKRGGFRENSGRPLLNENKGKRHTHGITLYDETWDRMVLDSAKLNISVSQFIEKIYKSYKKEN